MIFSRKLLLLKILLEITFIIIFLLPALFILILITLINFINKLKIGIINFERIGFVYPIYFYLNQKKNYKIRNLFILENSNQISNKIWYKIWKRKITILPFTKFFNLLYKLTFIIPKTNNLRIEYYPNTIDFHPTIKGIEKYKKNNDKKIFIKIAKLKKIIFNDKKIIELSDNEVIEAKNIIKKKIKTKEFICFHARDDLYLKDKYKNTNFDYHNYRNANINDFKLTANILANKNYTLIRMGNLVKEKISYSNNKIIDYANSTFKSDLLDIYLSSRCKFFILGDCGISIIPEIFKVPTVVTNFLPIRRISFWVKDSIFIFKKIFLINEKKFLNFSEVMKLDFETKKNFYILNKNNIKIIDNTPDEIRDASIEMELRLENKFKITKKQIKLQDKFWDLFGGRKIIKPNNLRISSLFLEKNEQLIK